MGSEELSKREQKALKATVDGLDPDEARETMYILLAAIKADKKNSGDGLKVVMGASEFIG